MFQLGQQLSGTYAANVLSSIPYPLRKATATGQTLEFVASNMLGAAQGHRANAHPLVVVMLGSESQDAVSAGAAAVKNLGSRVIVIAPSKATTPQMEDEMLTIASSPADIYDLDTVQALLVQGVNPFTTQFMAALTCANATLPSSHYATAFSPTSTILATTLSSTVAGTLFSITPSRTVPATTTFHHSTAFYTLTPTPTATFGFSSRLSSSVVRSTSILLPTPTPGVPLPLPTYCSGTFSAVDVVLIISESGKTGLATFQRFVSLAGSMVRALPLDRVIGRVAVVTLETIPRAVVSLSENLDIAAAYARIQDMQYPPDRATATSQTLDFVTTQVLSQRRSNALSLVVAMIGSESQNALNEIEQAAATLHSTGARVMVVGTRGSAVQDKEMAAIATSSADLHYLDTMEALVLSSQLGPSLFGPIVCNGTFSSSSSSRTIASSSRTIASSSSRLGVSSTMLNTVFPTPSPTRSSSPTIAPSSSVRSSVGASTSLGPGGLPTYCNPYVQQDIVFVLSASGQTGAGVFQQFKDLAMSMIDMVPAGTDAVR